MRHNKFLIPVLLTASVIVGLTLHTHAEGATGLHSKGRLEANDVVFDSRDLETIQTAIEDGKVLAYTSGYEKGKQEIIDNMPQYMGDYLNGKQASVNPFNVSKGTTTFTQDGFWIYQWFFRDTNGQSGDHEHGGYHHVTAILYDKDGNVKANLLDVTYTSAWYTQTPALLVVSAGDKLELIDYQGVQQGYYACQSSNSSFLTFE